MVRRFLLALAVAAGGCATDGRTPAEAPQVAAAVPSAADYRAAARLLETNLAGLVKNESVTPHWLGDSAAFWYERDTDDGSVFVVVDARTGAKAPAFDHAALAAGLSDAVDAEVPAENLGLSNVVLSGTRDLLTASTRGKAVECDLGRMICTAAEIGSPPQGQLTSPGGRWVATTRDDDLILVEAATGRERQLTDDGAPYYSYGKLPDTGLMVIQIRNSGIKLPPVGASFSPDDRYLIIPRIDERNVSVNPFVEWVPADGSLRPRYHPVRSPFTGDRNRGRKDLFVFDTERGSQTLIQPPPGYEDGLSGDVLGWSIRRRQAFMLAATYGAKKLALVRIDLETGKSTVVIEETARTRAEANSYMYNRPNVWIVGDGDEVIWYSDRSGWGHLYRYDAQSGAPQNAITAGDWLVQDIHVVDEARREIYLTGGGREAGRDPYYRHLYKVSFDGGTVTLLTDADADHHFAPVPTPFMALLRGIAPAEPVIRPDLGVFIDTYSTVSEPPVTVLRSTADGRVITLLETADASALYAAGWRAPVRQAVKAADGSTDIYTVYWAPQRDLPGSRHPVIDAVYGGPQVIVAPRNFVEAYSANNPYGQAAQARLGFAVVTTDARGTPLRSSAFRDAGYVEFTMVGIDDHVAAIRQLAKKYPGMDTSRVGIHGWSWGGTFSAQAILSRPDFYDVCVTGAGVYDYIPLYPGFEPATGVPVFKDGTIYRTEPGEKPVNYDKLDITAMAARLEGKMLIVYGDVDENVPPSQAFRLIDALTRANKPYDLVYIPNGTHYTAHPRTSGYSMQRRLDYFVEHLLGAAPPTDVAIVYD